MRALLTVLLMLAMRSVPAWAALGDDVSSVDSDLQIFGGQRRIVSNAGYNMHQITTPDGGVVKEFDPRADLLGVPRIVGG